MTGHLLSKNVSLQYIHMVTLSVTKSQKNGTIILKLNIHDVTQHFTGCENFDEKECKR